MMLSIIQQLLISGQMRVIVMLNNVSIHSVDPIHSILEYSCAVIITGMVDWWKDTCKTDKGFRLTKKKILVEVFLLSLMTNRGVI